MEIERKILGINERELTRKILALKPKPKKLFDGLVRVKYFDFKGGEIRRKKDLLRLREFRPLSLRGRSPKQSRRGWAYTELVYKIYKGVKNGCKYFEEIELKITGEKVFKVYEKFLTQLGFIQTLFYEKKRTLFSYGTGGANKKIKFEIDEHPKIPPFLEIEAPSPAVIRKCIQKLGLEKHEQTAESIGEFMLRKYPKISLNGLRFK